MISFPPPRGSPNCPAAAMYHYARGEPDEVGHSVSEDYKKKEGNLRQKREAERDGNCKGLN